MNLEQVKEFNGVNFLFKIPSVELVTLDLIKSYPWPEKARAVLFQFDSLSQNSHEVLWNNIGDTYFCRLYYNALKSGLSAYEECAYVDSIKKHIYGNHQEIEEVYINTISDHFWKPWGKYVFKFYGKERAKKIVYSQAKNNLVADNVLSHEKNGEVVSFLARMPVFEPVLEEKVDWVLWLWIKKDLEPGEKRHIKKDFIKFLKSETGNRFVVAPTEPFNFPPNVFWQKMGLKLGCAGITIKP